MPAYEIRLDEEAMAAAIAAVSPKIVTVQFFDGVPRVDASDPLTQAEIDAIKTVVAVRVRSMLIERESGPNILPQTSTAWDFRASATVASERAVMSPTAWEEVARVITTPGFFGVDPALFDVYAIGDYRATGTGVEVRITEERASDGDIAVLGTLALPDTGGAWSVFALDGFPVRLDRSRYRLEARTGVAIDVALCGFSMSLLEAR